MDLTAIPRANRRRSESPSPTSSPASTRWSRFQAALATREKSGRGQWIDMALFDVQVGGARQPGAELPRLRSRTDPARQRPPEHRPLPGLRRRRRQPRHRGRQRQPSFRSLVGVLGVPEIADEPITRTTRRASSTRAPIIAGILSALIHKFHARTTSSSASSAPGFQPVRSTASRRFFADPQIIDRGMRFNLPRAHGTNVPTVRTPILMSETHLVYTRARRASASTPAKS